MDYIQRSLHIFKEIGDRTGVGNALFLLGNVFTAMGKYDEAIQYQVESLHIIRDMRDKNKEKDILNKLGDTYQLSGQHHMAFDYYEQCLNIAMETNDMKRQENVHRCFGLAYRSLGRYLEAIESQEKSIAISQKIGNLLGEVKAHCEIGNAYYLLDKYHDAIISHGNSLAIATKIGDIKGQQNANRNLGTAYTSSGNYHQAIEYYLRSLHVAQNMGDKDGVRKVYGGLGEAYHSLGKYHQAIDYYAKSLEIAVKLGDRKGEAKLNFSLGQTYQRLGKYQEAIKYHKESLQLMKEIGDRRGEGYAYSGLGNVNKALGRYSKAIEYFEMSLNIATKEGSRRGAAVIYAELGGVYYSLGKYHDALKYVEKFSEFAKEMNDKDAEGKAYCYFGSISAVLGPQDRALKYFKDFLRIAREISDRHGEAMAYANIGTLLQTSRQFDEAISCFEKSLEIALEIDDKEGQSTAFNNLGNAKKESGKYDEAMKDLNKSHEISKEMGDRRAEGQALSNLGECFYLMSYYRKETSVDSLKKSERFLYEGIQCYEWLFDQLGEQDQFKISLADLYKQAYKMLIAVYIDTEQIQEALLVAERGRARALEDMLAANTTQQNEKKPFTYEIDNEITTESIDELIDKAYKVVSVRGAALENRSLKNFSHEIGPEGTTTSATDTKVNLRCIYVEDLDEDYLEVLFDALISPVQHKLNHDEIVIIPDGPLFKVPFAALRDPITKSFLSETKRIRFVPSLTTLKILKESSAESHSMTGALIVGDPDVTGKRIFKGKERYFNALPNAKLEAERIGELLGVTAITGAQATKQAIMQRLQEGVAVIHFAAHGCADSGEIVLSPAGTMLGEPGTIPEEEDYLLTINEVQEIGLRARLVVLSCCHSGRGEIKSEGVVGMSRAFLAAGALAVVASLWAVDDQATRVFMEKFYAQLKQGKSASTSLQQAMKDMRDTACYNKPMYWAPFFLIGDDVTISL
ncbi:hypothetical protein QZH41_006591 [Actinostola sp. cb2023]|nr:hypothetical protein QZH41_006591 [Actinostola sp. cb2023]